MKKNVPVLSGFKCPRLQFHFRSADPGVYNCQMKTPSNANNMTSVASANENTINRNYNNDNIGYLLWMGR